MTVLNVRKSGLPYYDALRLYGAIDIYLGVREDVEIRDAGDRWVVAGRSRSQRVAGRDIAAFITIRGSKRKPTPEQFCEKLKASLTGGGRISGEDDPSEAAKGELAGFDPVLQSGVRGRSAETYDSLNSSSNPRCIARIPLSDAILAFAGARRTETLGEISFLPIFEGLIDFGKVVNPLRVWLKIPNPLCAQALMLLLLKTSLWADGYHRCLKDLAYSKRTPKSSFNYSGIIEISSTAIGRIKHPEFCAAIYQIFREMVRASWTAGKATSLASHTLAIANWLMQPLPRTLGPMINAQEYLFTIQSLRFLIAEDHVREVLDMTFPENDTIDYEPIRQLAKTTSSAIYALGPKDDPKKRRQHWYNEIVAIRNSPNIQSLRHRVLTLIEMGRAQGSWVEQYDPAKLIDLMDRRMSFEEFRDCFRLYLIQSSGPPRQNDGPLSAPADEKQPDIENEQEAEVEAQ